MTRMWGGDSVPATTKVQPEWSPLSAQCPWDWMMAGIRFNSTCLTSHAEPTAPTTLRPSECRFMPTAEFAESTSPTDYTQKMNCLQSLNYTSQCNRRNNVILINMFFPPCPHLYIHSGSIQNCHIGKSLLSKKKSIECSHINQLANCNIWGGISCTQTKKKEKQTNKWLNKIQSIIYTCHKTKHKHLYGTVLNSAMETQQFIYSQIFCWIYEIHMLHVTILFHSCFILFNPHYIMLWVCVAELLQSMIWWCWIQFIDEAGWMLQSLNIACIWDLVFRITKYHCQCNGVNIPFLFLMKMWRVWMFEP